MTDAALRERLRTYEDPQWGYRKRGGKMETELFDGPLPEGWHDSPAVAEERRGPGRPPKRDQVTHGNGE